ncbi:MAG: hypothetical protein ACJAZO_005357 [Myxococcota bacterium]
MYTRSSERETTDFGARLVLHASEREHVEMLFVTPGGQIVLNDASGLEVFVVDGSVECGGVDRSAWAWLRRHGAGAEHFGSAGGATLFIKRDPL